jgi:hypothetical protein
MKKKGFLLAYVAETIPALKRHVDTDYSLALKMVVARELDFSTWVNLHN